MTDADACGEMGRLTLPGLCTPSIARTALRLCLH